MWFHWVELMILLKLMCVSLLSKVLANIAIIILNNRFTTDFALCKLAHAIYRDFFQKKKMKISLGKKYKKKNQQNIFAQNIHCGYMLESPR